jgi:hypothetical protein
VAFNEGCFLCLAPTLKKQMIICVLAKLKRLNIPPKKKKSFFFFKYFFGKGVCLHFETVADAMVF